MTSTLMIQGTSSGAGKSLLVMALCRIFSDMGYAVAPFKSQNMSSRSYSIPHHGGIISSAQAVQAVAARCNITSELNPVLLKPIGDSKSDVYLAGTFYRSVDATEYYGKVVLQEGLHTACTALDTLQKRYDLIILEGAGSPVEINLTRYDIANMMMAHQADASVLLVTDINRGGSFASLAGTMQLLDDADRKRIKGFIFNKFRGDSSILEPGFDKITQITKVPVLGVIPLVDVSLLPQEDSLDVSSLQDTIHWNHGSPPASIEKGIELFTESVKTHIDISCVMDLVNDIT